MDTSQYLILVLMYFAVPVLSTTVENGFIFTLPKVLRYGNTAEYCLTLHGQQKTSQNITLKLSDKSGRDVSEFKEAFHVGKQRCRKLLPPKPGQYNLHLVNETGEMHSSVPVTVLGDKLITLIQTDKPIYKPGQKVKFRVLTLMSDLRPRIGTIKSILVIDPNDIRVKQYLNVETKGITSLEFQLATEVKLGTWKVEILVDETDEATKEITTGLFTVMEYVLPRFEVEIIPPPFVMHNQKEFTVTVCAKYSYGKSVTGFLDLEVCWASPYNDVNQEACAKLIVKMTGCHSYTANVDKRRMERYYYNYELQIKASVTEEGTGSTVNKSHTGPSLTYDPLKIQLDDYSNGYFKPGLPFYGKAIVTRPDGTPAEGEIISITASDSNNDLKFSKNFTTDSYGHIVYSLCSGFTEKSKMIVIHAEAILYPSLEDTRTPRGYQYIRQWFSPSLSYIQIPRTDSSHKCGDRLTLSIPFTTQAYTNIEFNYQVMAKGKVIKTGQITYDQATLYPGKDLILPPTDICLQNSVPASDNSEQPVTQSAMVDTTATNEQPEQNIEERETRDDEDMSFWNPRHFEEPIVRSEKLSDKVSNFLLDLPITAIMSPKFNLLVYHILPDGEVVADSMQFIVNPCFDNQVKMEFNKTSVLPGEVVDINLKAAPGSVCGVGIVDKSVNILGGKHQITPELIYEKIEEFNTATPSPEDYFYNFDREKDTYCQERMRKIREEREHDYLSYTSNFVDAMQAFKSSGIIVLSNLNLQTRPCKTEDIVMYAMIPGAPVAVISQENQPAPPKPPNKIRSHFPETWLWDLHLIGESGESMLKEEAPHTITSWVGNAMCLDQNKGFGISKLTSLTTFQPFFLALHLPYAAVRGERLPIIFTAYSYLEKCLHIQLTLDLGKNFNVHNIKLNRDPVCICNGNTHTVKYYAMPTEIGNHAIFAQAEIIPGFCGNTVDIDTSYVGLSDAVKRQMLVKAEGVEQEYSHTTYICSKVNEPQQENVILPLPAQNEMVKDSARGVVQVIGDIMGPALSNLNNLVKMPVGCGEQNMVTFVPNIVVLKYLTSIGKASKVIQENAVKFMEIGYQRQLTYQHGDGSFSAFGKQDPSGSVWLTAFVVKSLAQSRQYVYIDDKDLTSSLKFLRHSQLETGCFRETGKVFQSYMMGGLSKNSNNKESSTALTAYVLIALLTAGVNTSEPLIFGALSCINEDFQQQQKNMDTYTLSLIAYANSLHQANNRVAREVLNVLESKAHKNGSLRFWGRETSKPKPKNTWFYESAPSAEVEMTSYVMLAYIQMLEKRAIERTHSIAMWLSQQRNPKGGFSSTQDTVIGLQALANYASLSQAQKGSGVEISVSGKQLNHSFSISEREDNALLLQTVPIPQLPNELSIAVKGSGCALVQVNVRYNKQPKDIQADGKPKFNLKVSTKRYQHNIDKCDKATITISVGRKGHNADMGIGMTLVSVKMVTGWTPITQSLTKLQSDSPLLGIKRFEYNEEQSVLTLYFDELSKKSKEFNIDVEQDRDLAVSNPKPADVKVFQYYETDLYAFESYTLKTICGTKEEIPFNPLDNELKNPDSVQRRIDPTLFPAAAMMANDVCPVCVSIKHQPKNLKEVVCNSTSIIKALAGRKGAYPLKLMQNLKSDSKGKLNTFSNYKMASGCDCSVLEAPARRVLIFINEAVSSNSVLNLDKSSVVILSDKQVEKQVRKLKKSC